MVITMAGEHEQPTAVSFREALFNSATEEVYNPLAGKRYLRIDPPEGGVLTNELLTRYLKDDPRPMKGHHNQPIYILAGPEDQVRMYQIIHDQDKMRTYIQDFDREGRSYATIGKRQNCSEAWLPTDTIPEVQAVWLPENHYLFSLIDQLPASLLERVNTDEALASRETLQQLDAVCPYLKEVLTNPVDKLQDRLDRLDRLIVKYKNYSGTQRRELGLSKHHSHWLLEQEELVGLISYRRRLAEKQILSLDPDDMEKACLEVCLDRLADQKEGKKGNELSFVQGFWLDELLVTLGGRRDFVTETPSIIMEKLKAKVLQWNFHPRDFNREWQLAEDLENKLKIIEMVKRRYYNRPKRTPPIPLNQIKAAVIQEETERQASEQKETPDSLLQPPQRLIDEKGLSRELTEVIDQLKRVCSLVENNRSLETVLSTKIRELETRKTRLEQKLGQS